MYVFPRSGRCNGRRLRTKYASAAIVVRVCTFLSEQSIDRRSKGVPLQPARLFVKAFDRRQLFGLAQLGLLHGGLQHVDGAVIDLERHRIGMAVFAAMGDGEPRRLR